MNKFVWLCALALIILVGESPSKCSAEQQVVGGISEEKRANSAIRGMVKALQPQISQQLSIRQEGRLYDESNPSSLKAISYSTQLVNGINYFIKIQTRIGQRKVYYHVKIYESFGNERNRTLSGIAGPMPKYAKLAHF